MKEPEVDQERKAEPDARGAEPRHVALDETYLDPGRLDSLARPSQGLRDDVDPGDLPAPPRKLLDAGPVPERDRIDRVRVPRLGRAVHEVPLPQGPFLTLDDQQRLGVAER